MREADYVREIRRTLDCEAPWYFVKVTENYDPHRIYVWVLHTPGATWQCPDCREPRELPADTHTPERTFLCLGSTQLTIYVKVALPRVQCPVHGQREADVPWTTNTGKWQRVEAAPVRGERSEP